MYLSKTIPGSPEEAMPELQKHLKALANVLKKAAAQNPEKPKIARQRLKPLPDGWQLTAVARRVDPQAEEPAAQTEGEIIITITASGEAASTIEVEYPEIVDQEVGVATNDMSLVCSNFFSGVGVAEMGGGGGGNGPVTRIYELDATGGLVDTHQVSGLPSVQGAAFIADEDQKRLLMVGVPLFDGNGLTFVWLDQDLEVLEMVESGAHVPSNSRIYWPQGLMKVGDLYIVAHMARDESQNWAADEGNVFLQFYDQDLNHLESKQVSAYTGPEGYMRPGISRKGEILAVSWDAQNVPIVVDVELDLSGAHVPGDSGEPVDPNDTDPGADDTGDGEVPIDGPCGCAASGGLAGAWLFGMVALWSRRRR